MGNIDDAIERGINYEGDGEYNPIGNVFKKWWVCKICGYHNTHKDIICKICEGDLDVMEEKRAKIIKALEDLEKELDESDEEQ